MHLSHFRKYEGRRHFFVLAIVVIAASGIFTAPLWKRWGGYIGFGLSVIPFVLPSVRHYFVSAQYLKNELIDFHQILYMHSSWQDPAWDCYMSFFAYFFQSYGPWFTPKFHLRSIAWEQIDRFSPNFIVHSIWQYLAWDCYTSLFAYLYQRYGLWFTTKFCFRSISWEQIDWFSPNLYMHSYWQDLAWDCYTSFFRIFVPELWPLIYAKVSFWPISGEQIDRFSPNFIYAFILTGSSLGLLHILFPIFVPESQLLIYANVSFPLNILRNKLIDSHQI